GRSRVTDTLVVSDPTTGATEALRLRGRFRLEMSRGRPRTGDDDDERRRDPALTPAAEPPTCGWVTVLIGIIGHPINPVRRRLEPRSWLSAPLRRTALRLRTCGVIITFEHGRTSRQIRIERPLPPAMAAAVRP